MGILEVQDIHTARDGDPVLRGVSLVLAQGTVHAVLGRNASGKTALIETILGLASPHRGSVVFKGSDITHLRTHDIVRRGIGVVPQNRRLFPMLDVEDNLAIAARDGGRRSFTPRRILDLFPKLEEQRRRHAGALTVADRQLLAIGRGLIANPELLILDEPTGGLPPIVAQGLWDALGEFRRDGMSILLAEQNAGFAMKVADAVAVLSKGQLVYAGTPDDLAANDEVRAAYLGF